MADSVAELPRRPVSPAAATPGAAPAAKTAPMLIAGRRAAAALFRAVRRLGVLLPRGWLFPGRNPVDPLSTRQLNRAVHAAADWSF